MLCIYKILHLQTTTLTDLPQHSRGGEPVPIPDSMDHGANTGPTWVLSAPGGPHVGPVNFAIRDYLQLYVTPTQVTQHTLGNICNSISASNQLHIDGLVQDCSNSSALAMELL